MGMTVDEELMAPTDEEVRAEVFDVDMVVGWWKNEIGFWL
jgi:hypothetical protein